MINRRPAGSSRYTTHETKRKAESVSSAGSSVPSVKYERKAAIISGVSNEDHFYARIGL